MKQAPSIESAIRAKDIVKHSFPTDHRNARYVAPARVELTKHGYCVYTITKIPGERARTHKVLINMAPGFTGTFSRCPSVRVDCDCARHKFVWNYALQEYDAAIRERTNGQPPVITNPTEEPGACKHMVVAIQYLSKLNPRWTSPYKQREGDTPWSRNHFQATDAGASPDTQRIDSATGRPAAVKLTTFRDAHRKIRNGQQV